MPKLGFYHLNEIGIATKKRTKAQSRVILLVHLAKIFPKVIGFLTLCLFLEIVPNNIKKNVKNVMVKSRFPGIKRKILFSDFNLEFKKSFLNKKDFCIVII